MKAQLFYVAFAYALGMCGLLSIVLWVRRSRLRVQRFLKQSFLMKEYESDSKK
jgi:hypothetical protein